MLGLAIRELAAVCTELQGVIKMDLAFLKLRTALSAELGVVLAV
jgi:hypothetical protein